MPTKEASATWPLSTIQILAHLSFLNRRVCDKMRSKVLLQEEIETEKPGNLDGSNQDYSPVHGLV